LIALGGGHIARALETLAKPLGFRYFVVDGPSDVRQPGRFVEADRVLVADVAEGLERLPVGPDASDRGRDARHRYDDVALERPAALSGAATWGSSAAAGSGSASGAPALAGVPAER